MAVHTIKYNTIVNEIITPAVISQAISLDGDIGAPDYYETDNAMWDTGATNTLVSKSIIEKLALHPHNKAKVLTAGGIITTDTYIVHIILPTGTAELDVEVLLNENNDYDIVIGMDIINKCDFCISNKNAKSTLSIKHPADNEIIFH